ncbi:nucleolar and coiled-body phosphoprotein 1 [Chironomus tepperi]|uniref:nucleolar and coiled-body phosphoprotein 1 n=1 Tax=Chironomus tepperi TaxID=113505 RepID=UPI00391F36F5
MESVSIEVSAIGNVDEKEQIKIIESVPKKVTTSLEIPADQTEKSMIARKQLDNLTKKRNKKTSPVTSDSENTSIIVDTAKELEVVPPKPVTAAKQDTFPEILYDGKPTMPNLSSAIISKEELEDEIRKKIVKSETQHSVIKKSTSYDIGSIEIPQELILSEINTSAASSKDNSQSSQLDEQQLIDILEGKDDQHEEVGQIIEVIGENGMFVVKDNKDEQTTSYEIISTEDEKMQSTKQKLLEREIAMRQIASMPTRKNRKLKQLPHSATSTPTQKQSLVQSLAMDWNDDDKGEEVILELENVEEGDGEPKIKILNMTILNESSEEIKSPTQIKSSPKMVQLPVFKNEPKILNKNAPKNIAPKILNVNAPKLPAEEPKRVIKKKTIWDPSVASTSQSPTPPVIEKKPTPNKLPINLPSTITIKKLTKESLIKNATAVADQKEQQQQQQQQQQQTPGRKGKKKSEIDKLFQDEGAVNMIYSLERQNNNRDVPEIEVNVDQKSMIDKSEEKTKLMAKAKTIKQTIMKQSTSPPEAKVTPVRPQRIKRDLTPSKSESDSSSEKKGTPEKTEKTVIVTKAQKTPAAGRKRKVDDSWDFVRNAQTTCDDAMIIRRHSNSSYSSSAPTSPRRLSLDAEDTGKFKEERNGFKFTKPQEKSPEIQKDLKSCVGGLVEELRNTLSTKLGKGKATTEKTPKGKKRTAAANNNNSQEKESPPAKQRISERRSNGTEKEFKIIKEDAVTQIILTANPLTITLLGEIKTLLGHLETDESCKIVLITASEDFSHGLDYSTLIQNTIDKRKQAASDLVTAVKNFFIFLAAFPKIIVCGLKGTVSGIAVSMLPLFDVVVAESSTKFSLPHGMIGSNVEGISILQASNKINANIITELFYMNEILNVTSALNYGLVSKIVPNNMESNAKEICMKMSTLSSQALESTKNILTEEFLSSIDQHLSKEVKILQQQWISAECQEKFKKYSSTGSW